MKIVFVRKLSVATTEETLRLVFAPYGGLERVKKVNDYAFVHYRGREEAERAIRERNSE